MSSFVITVEDNTEMNCVIIGPFPANQCCLCWAKLYGKDAVEFVYRGSIRRAHTKCLNVELVKLRLDGKH